MNIQTTLPEVQDRVSAAEWDARVNLAACYRVVALHGWTDQIFTHISAAVPGEEGHFLLNPYGLMFEEVTASSLVKIDLNGDIIDDTPWKVNRAGFTIHSAVHAARHDIECVIHTHTRSGMAVSAQKDGLLPICQNAMQFYGRLAYHDYEGIALDLDERERLVADLGTHQAMILRNHGLLVGGRTVAEAFTLLYNLEVSCQTQLAAQAGGELLLPPHEVCEHAASQFWPEGQTKPNPVIDDAWAAQIRRLDRQNPGYDA